MAFDDAFFQKDLIINRRKIKDQAQLLRAEYESNIVKQREVAEDWRDSDYETRMMYLSDPSHGIHTSINDDSIAFFYAIPNPYFMFVRNAKEYSYISSYISFGNILKYTTARASFLRYNSPERIELSINGDEIHSQYLNDNTESQNGESKKDSTRDVDMEKMQLQTSKNYEQKREHRIISNISDTLLQEQDQTIRTPKDSNTLIIGPAGSGKTNSLLHRIDYLTSEEGLKVKEVAFFCFNVGLKKYLGQSINQILGQDGIVISFDKWQEELIKTAFTGKVPALDYNNKRKLGNDTDVSNFIGKLSNQYSPSILKNKLINVFKLEKSGTLLRGVDMKEFEKYYLEISKNSSSIQCFYDCGIYLLRLIKDAKEKSGISFLTRFSIRRSVNIFSNLSKDLFGLDYNKKQFDVGRLLFLWNSKNKKDTLDYEDLSSSIIRSQLLYIVKDIAKCLPEKVIKETGRNKLFENFEHILVDEFQDLGSHQLLLIKNFSNQGITIAGDITQSLFLEPSSGEIKFSFPVHHVFKLSVTHRSTLETVQFANAILKRKNTNYSKSQYVVQKGDKPLICKLQSPDSMTQLIKNGMKKYPTSSFLVACYRNIDCEELESTFHASGLSEAYIAEKNTWDFNKNLHIANYFQVKGLEFDFVFITGLGGFLRNSLGNNKENILYTVLTRAKKRVIIVHNGEKEVMDVINGLDPDLFEAQNY